MKGQIVGGKISCCMNDLVTGGYKWSQQSFVKAVWYICTQLVNACHNRPSTHQCCVRGGVIIKKRENFGTMSELGLILPRPPPLSDISDFFEF